MRNRFFIQSLNTDGRAAVVLCDDDSNGGEKEVRDESSHQFLVARGAQVID